VFCLTQYENAGPKKLTYQEKLSLFYLKQVQFSKASVYEVHIGSNIIDDVFIVKFGQNSLLYGHQHARFMMLMRRCAS